MSLLSYVELIEYHTNTNMLTIKSNKSVIFIQFTS